MTKITHTIVLEGEDEEVWPFNKNLRTLIEGFKKSVGESKVVIVHEYVKGEQKNGGSNAGKLAGLAGKGVKAGWDFLFKEEKTDGTTSG